MKKGFTMIELIFVIVILGILASVAIPRLAATRDDAEVVKTATNLTTLVSDLGAYYTSQGKFADNLNMKLMSNVQFSTASGEDGTAGTAVLMSGSSKCIKVELKNQETKTEDGYKSYTIPARLIVTQNETGGVCDKVAQNDGVSKMISATFNYTKTKTDGTIETPSESGIAVSGVSVQF